MNISPFLSTNYPFRKALPRVSKQLNEAGLRTVQTFDLHSAITGAQGCSCPNHGTEECDCQLVVLLVYGTAAEPVTLILHGNGEQTWFSLVATILEDPNPQLQITIKKALAQQESQPGG
jgi:hypothetical protein